MYHSLKETISRNINVGKIIKAKHSLNKVAVLAPYNSFI